jgi:hypothetical protein
MPDTNETDCEVLVTPLPSCPEPFLPKQRTVPSLISAQPCVKPAVALTAVVETAASAGLVSASTARNVTTRAKMDRTRTNFVMQKNYKTMG